MINENTSDAVFGRLLDGAGAVVVAGIVVAGLLLIPSWFDDSKADVEAETARLEALLDDAGRIRSEHSTTSGELRDAMARLAHAIDRVPLAVDESAFVNEVVGHAERHGIRLGDYETGRIVSQPTHDELDVVIEGECDHGALCGLLGELVNSPRAGRVTDLEVDLIDPDEGRLGFRLVWRLYARPADVAGRTASRA